MSNPRSIVAVSATLERAPGRPALVHMNAAYTSALESAGLVPLLVPPLADLTNVSAILDVVDGLVLTGGEDIDPSCYGATPHAKLGSIVPERDATEIALTRAAHERGTPLLAICRGIQIANVALGGTLVQDLPSERPSEVTHGASDERTHEVRLQAGSRLADALGAPCIRVNSTHHQAIDRVAATLRATGLATDGVVEGVESADDAWWMLGVQWHPEELTHTPEPWDRALFAAFAERVREGRTP